MKGEKVDKGEKAFSKEIKGKDEVNVVQKYTQKGKCEVSCNKCFCVRHTAQCTVQHAGVRGVAQEQVQEYLPVAVGKTGQMDETNKSG